MAGDDDAPRRRTAHDIGQRLDDLSLGDFDERIALLQAEITRLQVARAAKERALADAGSVFRVGSADS